MARLSTGFHTPEPSRSRGPQQPGAGNRRSALLSDWWWQDRSLSWPGRVCDGAAPTAQSGPGRPAGRGRHCHHAVHASIAYPGPTRPRRRFGLRPGTGARGESRTLWNMAVRNRALGGQGRNAQSDGPQGRETLRFRPRQDPAIQGQSEGPPGTHPVGELSLVPYAVRAILVHTLAQR